MRIGIIARYDNSGLGTMCWEYARHLKPAKVLLVANGVYQTFPERFEEFENDYDRMASSLQVINKRLVLLNPVSLAFFNFKVNSNPISNMSHF